MVELRAHTHDLLCQAQFWARRQACRGQRATHPSPCVAGSTSAEKLFRRVIDLPLAGKFLTFTCADASPSAHSTLVHCSGRPAMHQEKMGKEKGSAPPARHKRRLSHHPLRKVRRSPHPRFRISKNGAAALQNLCRSIGHSRNLSSSSRVRRWTISSFSLPWWHRATQPSTFQTLLAVPPSGSGPLTLFASSHCLNISLKYL